MADEKEEQEDRTKKKSLNVEKRSEMVESHKKKYKRKFEMES